MNWGLGFHGRHESIVFGDLSVVIKHYFFRKSPLRSPDKNFLYPFNSFMSSWMVLALSNL
jgi:hypothetical protein